MANEFIARNGLIAQNNSTVSGSLGVTGSVNIRAIGALSTDTPFKVRNSADTVNLLTVNGDGTQTWLAPGNGALNSIKSGTVNLIQWGNESYGNIAIGYNSSNMITPTINYGTLIGSNTSILAGGAIRVGWGGAIYVGGDYGIGIGYGVNIRGTDTIHIGRRTGISSFSGLNSIHLGKTPSGNDISPSNVFMTHFDSEYSSTLTRGNGSFGLLGQQAYILGNGTGIYGTDTFMGNGGNTFVVRNHTSIPSTNIANSFQLYSSASIAGNAAPHFRTGAGNIVKLYSQAPVTSSQGLANVLTNLGFLTGSSVISPTASYSLTASFIDAGFY